MERQAVKGLLVKAVAGVYTVDAGNSRYECKARGIFRKQNLTPLVGDQVLIVPDTERTGVLEEVLPRKNALLRPPLANVEVLAVVLSCAKPAPNLLVADRMLAIAEDKGIAPLLIINKSDLVCGEQWLELYRNAGFEAFLVSCETGEGLETIKNAVYGKMCVFSGNTGVGKSTLLNHIAPGLSLATGEISEKLGRGRHTTRHVELFAMPGGGYLADTPGFSSFKPEDSAVILKENLAFAFREFLPYLGTCKFSSCSHRGEKGCAVVKAVKEGKIAESRYQSYCQLYEEASAVKDWER